MKEKTVLFMIFIIIMSLGQVKSQQNAPLNTLCLTNPSLSSVRVVPCSTLSGA